MASSGSHQVVHPAGWPPPRGFCHGMLTAPGGRWLAVSGQIGTQPPNVVVTGDLPAQFGRCLDNLIAVVRAAGGAPTDVVAMTVFVTDLPAYKAAQAPIGQQWRERLGKHYPAVTLVAVSGLLDPAALVEIQGFAVVPA